MKLIHCSFDIVDEFVPRVPDSRAVYDDKEYEDSTTPRICTAPSILHCLRAMPRAGGVIRWMHAVGMKPVIHAYYLQANSVKVCTSDEVPDADTTHAVWVLEKPEKVTRRDYEIVSCSMHDGKDMLGRSFVRIDGIKLKRVPETDNLKDLVESIGQDYGYFIKRFPFVTFREFATNITCTDRLRKMRRTPSML